MHFFPPSLAHLLPHSLRYFPCKHIRLYIGNDDKRLLIFIAILIAPPSWPVFPNGNLDSLRSKTFTQRGALNHTWELLGTKHLKGIAETAR
jgi:hypothetical protein